MRSYGGLSDSILNIEILTSDDHYVKIKDLINVEILDDILDAKYRIELDSNGDLSHLTSLIVWTDVNKFTLKSSPFGRFFIKENLNDE